MQPSTVWPYVYKFYFPPQQDPTLTPPARLDGFGDWFRRLAATNTLLGPAAWVVQTGLWMRHLGLQAEVVQEWPDTGIVTAHSDHLPPTWELSPDRFVVCCLADRQVPHPYANFHVVQNPYQLVRFGAHAYMPHWPQAGLLAHEAQASSGLMHLSFFGEVDNLAAPLREPAFLDWCRAVGLQFTIPPRDQWHDYRRTDVALAVRSFSTQWTAFEKPATKLFNAWLAGVVPIVGKEAAYAAEGRHGVDCLVVETLDELKRVLQQLQKSPELMGAMQKASRQRAQTRSHDAIALEWQNLLEQCVAPAAMQWRSSWPYAAFGRRTAGRVKAGLAWRGYLLHHRQPSSGAW